MECSGFNERKGRESDDNATELDLWRVIYRRAGGSQNLLIRSRNSSKKKLDLSKLHISDRLSMFWGYDVWKETLYGSMY
jgi:hypothetical protein